jgi:hypothetical protein
MIRQLGCCAIAGMVALASMSSAADPTPPKGFSALFNGKDLSGWHGWAIHEKGGKPSEMAALSEEERKAKIAKWTEDAKMHWSVENGELVNDGKGAYLATDKEYGDIEFLIEYKTVPRADSGIYLRSTPQVQIWDSTDESKFKIGADKGSGGLWNNSAGAKGKDPLVKADKPFGEWNSFRIIQVGNKTTIYMNDKLVVDHATMENYWDRNSPLMPKGKILLQTHGGEIRWRNIFIREIPADEANKILKEKAGEGFKSSFNGTDFKGWTGATENYEVVDGAIVCKPKKGGVLFTEERFSDFQVMLEYKVPPGGNNGLAIRYPGKGQGSYDGMCELQILDDNHPKYAKLDPRQFCGSAYGMAAVHKGYTRDAEEWNFMLVTVKGPTIRVELNGTQILDTDLSKVTEYMNKRPHPGKDLKEGHFGFCGHNDPVAFRSIAIKPIPLETTNAQ